MSRSNPEKCERLTQGLENILMIEQALDGLREEYSDARAKLLYKLLSSWKKDPTAEVDAAVKELREVLDNTLG